MAESGGGLLSHIGLRSATALVIANIIGAGIFTTTGFQAADLGHPGYIFALWIVGGVLAVCGALCFAELGAAMPHAGAEYVYLRETYGRFFGFMSAFISLTAGFSAPIAAVSKSFVRYASHFFPSLTDDVLWFGFLSRNDLIAVAIVWLLVAIHISGAKGGILFNDVLTLFKVCGILAIILCAAAFGKGDVANLTAVSERFYGLSRMDTFTAMGTSLIFVSFCYSGWNAAAYVAGEMNNAQRDLPRALLLGTGIVLLLYLGLNAVYFYGAGVDGIAGEVEVGLIAARHLFGDTGVTLVTLVLCVSIFASASAMTIAGPRVYYAFGRDFPPLRALAAVSPRTGAPTFALVLQGIVISIIVFSGRIDQIIQYAGFTLSLFASFAVSCVIVLRIRKPDMERPFKAWGYPVTPLLFLSISIWTMFWAFRGRPLESSLSLATVAMAGAAFFLVTRKESAARSE